MRSLPIRPAAKRTRAVDDPWTALDVMRPLRDVLSAEPTLAASLDRRRRVLAVFDLLRKSLPPALAAQTEVADATPTELVLSAATGAAATLLRHRAPDLLESLARRGWKFTGIRIRVQARPSPAHPRKIYAKRMDAAAASELRRGAEEVGDPGLAAALRRLASHAEHLSEREQHPLEGVEREHSEKKK